MLTGVSSCTDYIKICEKVYTNENMDFVYVSDVYTIAACLALLC